LFCQRANVTNTILRKGNKRKSVLPKMGDAPQKDVLNASANGQLGGEVETKLASGDCSQKKNTPSYTPIVLRD
jgi:hypothetical protein